MILVPVTQKSSGWARHNYVIDAVLDCITRPEESKEGYLAKASESGIARTCLHKWVYERVRKKIQKWKQLSKKAKDGMAWDKKSLNHHSGRRGRMGWVQGSNSGIRTETGGNHSRNIKWGSSVLSTRWHYQKMLEVVGPGGTIFLINFSWVFYKGVHVGKGCCFLLLYCGYHMVMGFILLKCIDHVE